MSNSAQTINSNSIAYGSVYRVGVGARAGDFPLLEQRIAIFAEGNADKQTEIAANGGVLVPLTAAEVAEVAGYGSPAHLAAKMLFDNYSLNVERKFFFIPEAGVATKTSIELAGTGATITKTGTLTLNINGSLLPISLVKDATLAEVLATIKDAINANVNYPCDVLTAAPTTTIDITSKWAGASSAELDVSVFSDTSTGITWALTPTLGTGETLPTDALAKLTNDWYPHVLNCLGNGTSETILDAYEDFNGTPAAGNGKYAAINMTPYVVWNATHESVLANITAVTDDRKEKNTNIYLAISNAQDFSFENAAEALAMFVNRSSGDPKQDVNDDVMLYATPPTDKDVGSVMDYNFRDALVKVGASTVNYKDGSYYTNDILTTYHPVSESDPVFRYVRDIMIVFTLIDQIKKYNAKQKNKTIAPNALPSATIISPALYKAGLLNEIIKPFVEAGYIAEFDYAKENLDVGINPTNSGRFDVLTPNLITSLLRIVAVDVSVNKFNG